MFFKTSLTCQGVQQNMNLCLVADLKSEILITFVHVQSRGTLIPGIRQRVSLLCFLCSGVKFEIDLPKKLVWIESDKDVEVLMETLKKCGKEVKYNGTK